MDERSKCNPSTIIVDGHTGQGKALTKGNEESIYSLMPEKNASEHTKRCFDVLHHIIKVPCLCHIVSNSYKASVSANETIFNLITKFRDSANFIKNSKEIDFSCPTFIPTRWLYDFDIINFF